MNRFFEPRDQSFPFEVPKRVYALLIDGEDGEFVLFDAVDANDFDQKHALPGFSSQKGNWRDYVDRARIYAIEINASESLIAKRWLERHPYDLIPVWAQIELVPAVNGEAAVYDNIAGPALRAKVVVRPLSTKLSQSLQQATDLTRDKKSDSEIKRTLPAQALENVFVLDVGQGSANALVTGACDVVAYVDLGAGVLSDAKTWPASMAGICLMHRPTIILSHWHYDHFQAANKYPAALLQTWIAPFQTLGPGPQSAMASAIASAGTLMVWNGTGILTSGTLDLERCIGPVGNQNRTGIAVWVRGPAGSDPILLPGDAGYCDIPALATQAITGLAVAHHGGRAPGTAPTRPGGATTRAALS